MTRVQLKGIGVILLVVLAFMLRPAGAQGTAFTYQGLINNGALPANGLHDFRFRLFDAPAGGSQLGQTDCIESVVVVNGVFNVLLDFGDQFVTSGTRHLEIHVRQEIGQPCTDDFGYVLLTPRQRLTAAPQASHAQSAFALAAPDGSPANAVIVDNDGNVGIGISSPGGKLDIQASNNSNVLFGRRTGGGLAHNLFIDGSGNGSLQLLDSTATPRINLGAQDSTYFNYGNVGIGTEAPVAKLDVHGDIRLGPTGQLSATSGEENLRIIRGYVTSAGNIIGGSGFTVQHNATGVYSVTFVNNFTAIPSVTATAGGNLSGVVIKFIGLSQSGVTFDVYDSVSEQFINKEFSFIAIGPR